MRFRVARIVDISKERMNKGVTGGIGYKMREVTQRRVEDEEGWKQVKRKEIGRAHV